MESVILTKSVGGDYQIVVSGLHNYTKQFPRFEYHVTQYGVRLVPYVGDELMLKEYLPSEWTIDYETGFTTTKQVTDAITILQNNEYDESWTAGTISPIEWGSGRKSIIMIGDSIGRGAWAGLTDPSWLANGYIGQIKSELIAKYGDGGVGFKMLTDTEFVASGSWTSNSDFGLWGTCKYSNNSASNKYTLTIADGDNVDVFYLAGYSQWSYKIDGGVSTLATLTSGTTNNCVKTNINLGSVGAHTLEIIAPASGYFFLLGAAIYKGNGGVVIHNVSVSGSDYVVFAYKYNTRLNGFIENTGTKLVLQGLLMNDFSLQKPLVDYTTANNNVTDWIKARCNYISIIPNDSDLTKVILQPEYENVLKVKSISDDMAWISIHDKWGEYTDNTAKMYDTVHPNQLGHNNIKAIIYPKLLKTGI